MFLMLFKSNSARFSPCFSIAFSLSSMESPLKPAEAELRKLSLQESI